MQLMPFDKYMFRQIWSLILFVVVISVFAFGFGVLGFIISAFAQKF
jgi:hypothetical protein